MRAPFRRFALAALGAAALAVAVLLLRGPGRETPPRPAAAPASLAGGAAPAATQPAASAATPAVLARGAYVMAAAGCAECHTDRKDRGKPLAGGRALETPYGVFHTPNITRDEATGIGRWSEADFRRALREGVGPDGTHFFPAFPYPSYTGMTDADIADLYAYLFSLPPVAQADKPHEIRFPFNIRALMPIWNRLYLKRGPYAADASRSPAWNRGAYLVQVLGHCGECHTPRNALGAVDWERPLAGSDQGPEGSTVPNITPDPETGIGKWSETDITYLLETGLKPDGDNVGDGMGEVVEESTGKLTPEDRAAIAKYLKSLKAIRHPVQRKAAGS
jgi:mono/diheme cytochrome c family protein